jgi:hypothetical protein
MRPHLEALGLKIKTAQMYADVRERVTLNRRYGKFRKPLTSENTKGLSTDEC